MRKIQARGIVPASPAEVFGFLADLDNHWQLEEDFQLLALNGGDGGRVRLRGPLGIHRTAHTEVTERRPLRSMTGIARIGARTTASVSWTLRPFGSGRTCLELSAEVREASVLDRLLLAAGGRAWLERRFGRIVGRLAAVPVDWAGDDHVAAERPA
jgi:Polyketide cyclase / dehydrase and lipid transport